MSIPKEPRQMMINLMYLVLTAMLALNITREVLNAFNTINSSIVKSNTTIGTRNEQFYAMFDAAEAKPEDRERVAPWNARAKEVKKYTTDIYSYLEQWKDSVINRSGGYTTAKDGKTQEIKSMEDIDAATRLFVEEKKGDQIKAKLQEYIDNVLNQIPDDAERTALRSQIPLSLDKMPVTEENPSGDWTWGTFHNIPVVAAVAMFSKFQNDVRNAESMVVEHLYNKVGEDVIIITDYMPVATANTSYALAGDEITANISLAAVNKAVNPRITSNKGAVSVQDGVGTVKFRASGTGMQTLNGTIAIPVKGVMKSYPYEIKYMVGSAGGSVQLDKMNVMYIGVDNPVTASASGYNIEDVNLSIPGATVSRVSPGKYNVRVSTPSAQGIPYSLNASKGGAGATIASGVFRVKRIPDPVASLGGTTSGNMLTNRAKAQMGPLAELKDFDFDARFQVRSFTFALIPQNGYASEVVNNGPRFTQAVEDLKSRSKPGDMWIIKDIKAVGPDNTTRTLNPISVNLN